MNELGILFCSYSLVMATDEAFKEVQESSQKMSELMGKSRLPHRRSPRD